MTYENVTKKTLNAQDSKNFTNLNKNNQRDCINDKKEDVNYNMNSKELRVRGFNTVSSEKSHNSNNAISFPKDFDNLRLFNNSHSNDNKINEKQSLGKSSFERTNSIDNDKKNNHNNKHVNNFKIPINMNNIHSFNINVITQTVSNQVNNFISTLSAPINNINQRENGSSKNLINIDSSNNNSCFYNNLIPIKKKK